jgi:hypothetical protein
MHWRQHSKLTKQHLESDGGLAAMLLLLALLPRGHVYAWSPVWVMSVSPQVGVLASCARARHKEQFGQCVGSVTCTRLGLQCR